MRDRLLRGSRNKAERGELFLRLPVGYVKLSTGEVIQEPDEQVRGMVQLVFDKFQELGSSYAVYQHLLGNNLELGFRLQSGPRRGELEWRCPNPTRILWILKQPFYAGGVCIRDPSRWEEKSDHRPGGRGKWFVSPEEMQILISDRLPAYISWDQYSTNREQLQQNRSLHDSRGVHRPSASVKHRFISHFPDEFAQLWGVSTRPFLFEHVGVPDFVKHRTLRSQDIHKIVHVFNNQIEIPRFFTVGASR